MQQTNLQIFIKSIISSIFGKTNGSWRNKSLVIVSLLLGFYLTNNLVSYYLDKNTNSILIVLLLVLFSEVIVRFNSISLQYHSNLLFILLNNLRIGMTYSLVLEAFKLGS